MQTLSAPQPLSNASRGVPIAQPNLSFELRISHLKITQLWIWGPGFSEMTFGVLIFFYTYVHTTRYVLGTAISIIYHSKNVRNLRVKYMAYSLPMRT